MEFQARIPGAIPVSPAPGAIHIVPFRIRRDPPVGAKFNGAGVVRRQPVGVFIDACDRPRRRYR